MGKIKVDNKVRHFPCPTGATFKFPDGEKAVISGFVPMGRGWTVHFFNPDKPEEETASMAWLDFKSNTEEI